MPIVFKTLTRILNILLKLKPWIFPPIKPANKINVPGDESQLIGRSLGFFPK